MNLKMLKKGELAEIIKIDSNCSQDIRERLLDLGFVKGTEIFIQNISPLGDPVAYNIHNTQISLRKEDAIYVLIKIKP